MTSVRDEAQNPAAEPDRLHELINLPRDRGDGDSDAGWCREHVAANPNVSLATLRELAADKDNCMARRNAANNPSLASQTLWMMIEDRTTRLPTWPGNDWAWSRSLAPTWSFAWWTSRSSTRRPDGC